MAQGQELQLSGGGLNASTLSEAVTSQLWRLCEDSVDAKQAARRIAANPARMAEAREKLSLVARVAGPVGPDACYVALQPLVIQYGIPPFGPGEEGAAMQEAWWRTTIKALQDLPRESLDLAVDRYIATQTRHYFPNPGTLRKLCEAHATKVRMVAWRIRKAVEENGENTRPPPEVTKEVGDNFRNLAQQLKASRLERQAMAPAGRFGDPHRVGDAIPGALRQSASGS
jgi:hypothetical protein